jgi:hypothetical protein
MQQLLIMVLLIFNNSFIKIDGNFLIGFDNYVFFAHCEECIDEYPAYNILYFDFMNNKIDIFISDIMFFDFEKIGSDKFIFTDGHSIYQVNVDDMSKKLIYSLSDSNNIICDLVFRNNELLYFQASYETMGNRMLIYKIKDNTAILLNSVPFSELEYRGLNSAHKGENIYFATGQNLYLLDQSNNLSLIAKNVYEFYSLQNVIIYGMYNENHQYEYKILNLKTNKIDNFSFPNNFNKLNWRNSILLNINNNLYYFQNSKIFTLSDDKWIEIEKVIVYENINFKVSINNLKETIILF